MAGEDVKIKVSMDGDKEVASGLGNIGDAAGQTDSKLGKLVKGGLKGAGVAALGMATAAVGAGTALAAGVSSAYADAEQSVGGIETLFKGSADKMKQYASQAYATAGLSANDYMEQATSMSASLIQSVGGDTAKAAELANDALVSMSDNANKMGSDLGSIQDAYSGFAKQNYTMLDNLKLGYGGTQAEMQRLLSDAEKLPSALGQEFDISNYGDVVTAIKLVQEEMGIAGTTALEAEQTISGSVGMLKGSFDNLLVAMGSANNESLAFLDVQEQAANVVSSLESVIGNVVPVIESIGSSMGTLGPQLGGMMETVVQALATAIPAVLDTGVALVGGLVTGITGALPSLITALVPGVVGLVQSLATLAPQLITAGVQAVVALAQGLAQAAPQLIPAITSGLTGMVQALIDGAPAMLEAGLALLMGLAQGIIASIPTLISSLPQLITGIITFLIQAIPMIIQTGIDLLLALVTALPQIIAGIVAALPEIITGIVGALMKAIPQLINAGITLFTSLIKALPKIISGIIKAVPQIISSLVKFFSSSVPQMVQAGFKLLMGLITKLPSVISKARSGVLDMLGKMLSALASGVGRMASTGFKLLMGVVRNFPSAVSNIVGKIPGLISRLVSAIGNGISQMASVGRNLVTGIWSGISGAAGWLFGKVKGFANDVVSNVKGFFGIKSPSRVMMEVGKYVVQGLAKGIQGTSAQAEKAALTMVNKIRKAMSAGEISDRGGEALIKRIKSSNRSIQRAINQREKVLKRLDSARKNLQKLEKERQEMARGIRDQVIGTVDLSYEGTTKGMRQSLEAQIKAVRDFRYKLAKLQKMGLDNETQDQMLQDFLKTGDSAMADTLLKGGSGAVKQIAALQKKLSKEGSYLGSNISKDLYKAGINAAKGLVRGLNSQQKSLDKAAARMGTALVKAIKKRLKIKSPSRVFEAEVGAMIPAGVGLGVAKGLDKALVPVSTMVQRIVAEGNKLKTDTSWDVQSLSRPTEVSVTQAVPQAYAVPTQIVVSPKVEVDTDSFAQAMDRWAAAQPSTTQVDIHNDINMMERDPRIVGKQLGRAAKGVLLG